MRRLIVFTTVLLVLIAGSTVLACDCVTLSPSESLRRADVVFEGQVIQIVPTSSGTNYTFQVSKSLKGLPARELTLEQGAVDCDATFSQYTRYRVHARYFEGKLFSGTCDGNETLGFIRVTRDSTKISISKLLPSLAVGLVAAIIWLLIRRRT
jgi:hypothetical protein